MLFMCFSVIVCIYACFRFVLFDGNLTAQSMGSHKGIGGRIKIPGMQLQALLPIPALLPEGLGEVAG